MAAGGCAGNSQRAQERPAVKPLAHELVALNTPHKVFLRPGVRFAGQRTIQATRPITGGQTVLPVIAHATMRGGARWLRVMVPGRPNGTTGWISQRGAILVTATWKVVVRTSSRRVLVYRHARLVRSFAAIVGKPSTPTPHGRFFVEETVRMDPSAAGAPYALALSARSNVLQEFDGGPGQIAIHGLAHLGGAPGSAISHGCVRLTNPDVSWLAAHISAGTQVDITT